MLSTSVNICQVGVAQIMFIFLTQYRIIMNIQEMDDLVESMWPIIFSGWLLTLDVSFSDVPTINQIRTNQGVYSLAQKISGLSSVHGAKSSAAEGCQKIHVKLGPQLPCTNLPASICRMGASNESAAQRLGRSGPWPLTLLWFVVVWWYNIYIYICNTYVCIHIYL